MTPKRLPEPDPPQAGDTVVIYGSRVLSFLLREGVYATVSTEALQLAEHAAVYAVAHHDVLPSIVDKISAVRHIIAQTLRVRLQDAAMDATLAIGSPVDTRPNNGPMAKLQDAPLVKPPAPSYAEIERVRAAIQF